MPAWPLTLPEYPLSGTLRIAPEVNVAEFKVEVGAPLRRRRYTARRKFYTAEMMMTEAQRAILDTFFATDCADGALSFTMADWVGGASATFYWNEPPSIVEVPVDYWRVSVSLTKEP